jgi:hypothetical protein
MLFQIGAIIQNIKTLGDGTIRLQVDLNEIKPEETTILFNMWRKAGYFLFKENQFQIEDVPIEDANIKENEMSQSQRLTKVLFVYWKKRYDAGKITKNFNEFKQEWFENKIQQIKDNIDL